MSGYLAGLVRRVLEPPNDVRPRATSPFDPGRLVGEAGPFASDDGEIAAAMSEGAPGRAPHVSAPERPTTRETDTSAQDPAATSTDSAAVAGGEAVDAVLAPSASRAERPPIGATREPWRPVVAPETSRPAALLSPRAAVSPPPPGVLAPARARTIRDRASIAPPLLAPRATTQAARRGPRSSLPSAVAATLGAQPRPDRAEPAHVHTDEPSIVQVSIGRIEVRAVQTPAPLRAPARAEPAHVQLSEYLRRRDARER